MHLTIKSLLHIYWTGKEMEHHNLKNVFKVVQSDRASFKKYNFHKQKFQFYLLLYYFICSMSEKHLYCYTLDISL